MATDITGLSFEKRSLSTCLITEELWDMYGTLCTDLGFDPSMVQAAKTTALLFLCELLDQNNIYSSLTEALRKDLHLQEKDSLTQVYFPAVVTDKYIKSVEVHFTTLRPEKIVVNYLPISKYLKNKLKKKIIAELPKENYDLYEASSSLGVGEELYIHVLKNREFLESFLGENIFAQILPRMEYLLEFTANYLEDIPDELPPVSSTLNSFIHKWLPKYE